MRIERAVHFFVHRDFREKLRVVLGHVIRVFIATQKHLGGVQR